jgi:16S rRNA C1402 N4-methylase RsmH
MVLFKNGQRDKAFIVLYKLLPRIEKLVLSKRGAKADAHDMFQEALIILNRNLEKLLDVLKTILLLLRVKNRLKNKLNLK